MHKYLKYKNKYLQLKNQIGGNALNRLKEVLENPSDLLLHVMNNDMTLKYKVKTQEGEFTMDNVKNYIDQIYCSIITSMEFRHDDDCSFKKPSTIKYIDWIIKSYINGTIKDSGLLFTIVKKIKDYMKINDPVLDSFYGYDNFYITERNGKLFFKDFMEYFVIPKVIKFGQVNYGNDKYIGEYIIIDEDELPVKNGKGILEYSNGDIYNGKFKNDLKDGFGIFRFFNGDTYNGFFKENIRSGFGILKHLNGSIYSGTFNRSIITNGKCIIKYDNGDEYIGGYHNNMNHGYGIYKWKNGEVYEGNYEINNKHGLGKFTYNDGDIYIGNFKDNYKHGEGKYIYKAGYEYEGIFDNDKIIIIPTEPTIRKDLEHTITLFIIAHGCDMVNKPIDLSLYKSIKPIYISSTKHRCINSGIADKDLIYASIIFNKNPNPIKLYQEKKKKTVKVPVLEYEHKFAFGHILNTYTAYDGIFIIQNNIGLPNNINILDLRNQDNINPMISEISANVVKYIEKDGKYDKTMKLSNLIKSFNDFSKELNLQIVDYSCRVQCP